MPTGNLLARFKDSLSPYAINTNGGNKPGQNSIKGSINGCTAINDSFKGGNYASYGSSGWPSDRIEDKTPRSVPSASRF